MNTFHYTDAQLSTWLHEASMPVETDDGWIDMDTGVSFEQSLRPPSTAERRAARLAEMKTKHGAAIAAAEALAKESGWSPLTGTTPQKAWAAQIRASLISKMPQSTAQWASRITKSKFWIENRNLELAKLEALILEKRPELEAAATTRKEAAVKAKETKRARKILAEKFDARDSIVLELLDIAAEIPATPAVLGSKIIQRDDLRVFVDADTKLVTFLIKRPNCKEVRQTTLDADREERMRTAMS